MQQVLREQPDARRAAASHARERAERMRAELAAAGAQEDDEPPTEDDDPPTPWMNAVSTSGFDSSAGQLLREGNAQCEAKVTSAAAGRARVRRMARSVGCLTCAPQPSCRRCRTWLGAAAVQRSLPAGRTVRAGRVG